MRDALCGTTIELKMLDDRIVRIAVPEIVSPNYEKVIHGQGMPITKTPGQRGNLIIKFDVLFPRHLSETQKETLKQALPTH